jgi:hypothetical protein
MGPFRASGRTLFFVPSKTWATHHGARPGAADVLLNSASVGAGSCPLPPEWEALYELTVLSPSASASA